MLKHCHANRGGSRRSLTPSLTKADNASLNSSGSASFNSSFGSDSSSSASSSSASSSSSLLNQSTISSPPGIVPSPAKTSSTFSNGDSRRSSFSSPEPISLASRASSFASLSLECSSGIGPKTPIKIFAKCLRPDIEYKTLSAGSRTTSKELIWMLLSKYKMKHRDPNLFYLTMDIQIKRSGVPQQRTIVLDDDSRPAELKSCQPWGECKFSLQMRKGWLVRVYDSVLMAESKYKCLLIAEHTTVQDVVKILFHCYNLERIEQVERYCIYEQCQSQLYERRLHPTDRPAMVQSLWPVQTNFQFVLQRETGSSSVKPIVKALDLFGLKSDGESDSYSASTPISSPVEPSDSPASSTKSDRLSPESTTSSSSSESSSTSSTTSLTDESMTSIHSQNTPKMLRPRLNHLMALDKGPGSLPPIMQGQVARSRNAILQHNANLRNSRPILPPKICPLQLQKLRGHSSITSIHESGLPPPPVLRPKPSGIIYGVAKNRTSLGSLSSGSRSSNASFHEYENYFYI